MKKNVIAVTMTVLLSLSVSSLSFASGGAGAAPGTKADASYLLAHGASKSLTDQITPSTVQVLNKLAKDHQLTNDQVKNLVTSTIENKNKTDYRYTGSYRHVLPNGSVTPHDLSQVSPDKIKAATVNSSATVSPNSVYTYSDLSGSDSTGTHWIIKANPGQFKEATGYTTTPAGSNMNIPSVDRGYMYFGGYTTDGALSSDAGILFTGDTQKWEMFMNLEIWNPQKGGYDQEWDETEINFANPYITYNITYYSYGTLFELNVVDPATWTNHVYSWGSNDTQFPYALNPVWSDYGNLQMIREDTIASSGTANIHDGAKFDHAQWDQVYLYAPDGNYYLWGPDQTALAGRGYGDGASTVTVNSYTAWSSDDISIDWQ